MHGLLKCVGNPKPPSFSLSQIAIIVTIIIRGSKHMEARICCFVLALQIVGLVSATSRPFAPNDGVGVNQAVTDQSPQPLEVLMGSKFGFQLGSKQGIREGMEGVPTGMINEEAAYSRGMSKLGSSPPSCDHKCYGCIPCEAIQVPTTSKTHSHHLGVNYANYEPEGWKCKCGPSFYSP